MGESQEIKVKVFETVDEHNARRRAEREERERRERMTGVACPKCGGQLEWVARKYTVASWPPRTTRPAECRSCRLGIDLEE